MKKKAVFVLLLLILLKAHNNSFTFTPENIEQAFAETVNVCGNLLYDIYQGTEKFLQRRGLVGDTGKQEITPLITEESKVRKIFS